MSASPPDLEDSQMAISHATGELHSALESFDRARDGYLKAFRALPSGATSYLN